MKSWLLRDDDEEMDDENEDGAKTEENGQGNREDEKYEQGSLRV